MRSILASALLLAVGCQPGPVQPTDETVREPRPEPCEDPVVWFEDLDADGYGTPADTLETCGVPETGWARTDDDCDDSDPGTFPGAIEVCDGVDRDCDGMIDEDDAVDAPRWYPDADADGYPNRTAAVVRSCLRPGGYQSSARPADCNDDDPAIHPGADDPPCDGLDQSCLGLSDREVARVAGRAFSELEPAILESGGARIEVCPGAYRIGTVRIEHDLVIHGITGEAADVVIQSAGGPLFSVQADRADLSGITLRGAPRDGEGRLLDASVQTLDLLNVVLSESRSSGDGAGVRARAHAVSLYDVRASDLHAGGSGGALDVRLIPTDGTSEPVAPRIVGQAIDVSGTSAQADGGALHLSVDAPAATIELGGLLTRATSAGGDGGAVSIHAREDVRTELNAVFLLGGTATNGGLIAIDAPGTLWLQMPGSRLEQAVARERGGLIAVDGGDVDVDSSRSEFDLGTAGRSGGLLDVQVDGLLDLYANTATLTRGTAPAGPAWNVAGSGIEASEIDCDNCLIAHHRGGPAIEVSADTPDGLSIELVGPLTRLVHNPGGGLRTTSDATVFVRGIDLGTGAEENEAYDILFGDALYDGSGTDVWLRCSDGACRETTR